MARIIEELEPRAVMMENVPGLATRGKGLLAEFVARLASRGYIVNCRILQLADYGVPQTRRRLVLLAGKGFAIAFPRQTHSREGSHTKRLKPWRTLADAIRGMAEPVQLSKAKRTKGPRGFDWHVVSDLASVSLERLQALGPGSGRTDLPRALRPKCHAKSNEGFENVYGRLSWHQPAPTITAGFTAPAMGRFGHPTQLRTISVREAALIQTFPRRYRLDTQFLGKACALVGNALPPRFAEAVSLSCASALRAERNDAL
jgi:DNA (cytosine-5)-methyltransferase 1